MEFFDTSIVEHIEMKMIRPSQYAVRNKFQKISPEDDTLVASIREHGLLQPILIRPLAQGFEIVAGHRRFQACRSLRCRFIPCKIREMSDKDAYEIQLTENMQRKAMDAIEEAEAFRRYVLDFGWGGVSELARRIGMSEEYVSHRIQLLKLPENVKEQIAMSRLNVSCAIELSNFPQDAQSEIIEHVTNNNMTVRELREFKSRLKNKAAPLNLEPSTDLNKSIRILKVTKKTTLALKIMLARLDSLIDEIHETIEPAQRGEIINFLMETRLKVHGMIDDAIRFRNSNSKVRR
ncbi:MAG: ParB/RepB/Spo0J family partition protein [Nitrososphaeraceae archaeon]